MKKKLLVGAVAGLAAVGLLAAPALAAPTDPGVLATINAGGGQGTSDGLKLDIAFGQVQITREAGPQFYPGDDIPDATDPQVMSNYFVVALKNVSSGNVILVGDGDNFTTGNPATLVDEQPWDSFTSESTLSDDGKSGTVINHLTRTIATDFNGTVNLDVTFAYTYPNAYYTVTAALTLVGDFATGWSHKLYWYTDALLGGSDDGNQFGGLTPGGQSIAGVTNPAGDRIEAFRQVAGQNLNWFAGYYTCPYTGTDDSLTTDDCGTDPGLYGFIAGVTDFPNVYGPGEDIDNGFGVSSAESTSATETVSFDLLFTSCLEGVTPYECADAALNPLPNTGVDSASVAGFTAGALAIVIVGFALVAIRRRNA